MLQRARVIALPVAPDGAFDHGAWESTTDRVFVAHTSAGRVEVIDHESRAHVRSLEGFPEAAGVVAEAGTVLVTCRGAATLAVVDARSLATCARIATGPRPNGVALAAAPGLAVVACLGDDRTEPTLQVNRLDGRPVATLPLPGRPRWCVLDATATRVYCAIREPSLVLVADLPDLADATRWPLPTTGAHGLDIDPTAGRLYVACDGGELVAVSQHDGAVVGRWPLPGVPDATFFNPASGWVHVAVGTPGVVVSIDPRTGREATCPTALAAKTTALVPPDRLYAFSAAAGGAIELIETEAD